MKVSEAVVEMVWKRVDVISSVSSCVIGRINVAVACSRVVVVLNTVESDVVRALVTSDSVSVRYSVLLSV